MRFLLFVTSPEMCVCGGGVYTARNENDFTKKNSAEGRVFSRKGGVCFSKGKTLSLFPQRTAG